MDFILIYQEWHVPIGNQSFERTISASDLKLDIWYTDVEAFDEYLNPLLMEQRYLYNNTENGDILPWRFSNGKFSLETYLQNNKLFIQ